MRPLERALVMVLGSLVAACGERGLPEAEARVEPRTPDLPMQLQDHGGLVTGTTIAPTTLTCDAGRVRALAPTEGVQLVTFTTPGDCSACHTHLAGLDSLDALGQLTVPHLYVSYATRAQRADASRAYERVIGDGICWDDTGALWDAYGIAHTPVTVLLRDGTVVLVHDAPLTSDQARKALVDTVGVLSGPR